MFEYTKKLSLAIKFIAEKMDSKGQILKDIFLMESIEFLKLSQNFRNDETNTESLKKLKEKILYFLDLIDYAKMDGTISYNNSLVFTDSLSTFLKYLTYLEENITQPIYSLDLPLKEMRDSEETFNRKMAKGSLLYKSGNTATLAENITKTDESNFNKIEIKTEQKNGQKIVPETLLNRVEINPELDPQKIKQEMEKRRTRIMNALTVSGGSIKDILTSMSDINEKTVQRDLNELIVEKKVIMLGKKRWAKYYVK